MSLVSGPASAPSGGMTRQRGEGRRRIDPALKVPGHDVVEIAVGTAFEGGKEDFRLLGQIREQPLFKTPEDRRLGRKARMGLDKKVVAGRAYEPVEQLSDGCSRRLMVEPWAPPCRDATSTDGQGSPNKKRHQLVKVVNLETIDLGGAIASCSGPGHETFAAEMGQRFANRGGRELQAPSFLDDVHRHPGRDGAAFEAVAERGQRR